MHDIEFLLFPTKFQDFLNARFGVLAISNMDFNTFWMYDLLKSIEIYWNLLKSIEIFWNILKRSGPVAQIPVQFLVVFNWNPLNSIEIYWGKEKQIKLERERDSEIYNFI